MRFALLAVAAAALLLAGCSGPAAQPDGPSLDLARDVTVPARGFQPAFAEVDVAMAANESFEWRWNATGDLSFDIHSHAADQVATHLRHFGNATSGTFVAPAAGTYSLMWENFGPRPVALRYELRGEGRVHA